MNNQYVDVLEALANLQKRGFIHTFDFKDNLLHCLETKISFQPQETKIVEFHRFEGTSDFEDMSVLYAVETNDGTKGTILDAYGTYADANIGEFLKQTGFVH
jgi:hypothetical protein